MDWFNEVFDLAAVASGAGLAGGGGGAVLAWMIRGAIMRFIARTLITALLTGIGFYILLGVLGFQIVPAEEAAPAGGVASLDESDTFRTQGVGETPDEAEDGGNRIVVKSPFRRGG